MLRRLYSVIFLLAFFVMLIPQRGIAATPIIIDQPIMPGQPPIIITEFGGGLPDFFELYNQSAQAVFIKNWYLTGTIQGVDSVSGQTAEQPYEILLPSGWLLPKQYHTFQRGDGTATHTSYYQLDTQLQNPALTKMALIDSSNIEQDSIVPAPALASTQWAQHKQRINASLKISGVFTTDYAVKTVAPTVFSDALYTPPEATPLQILEILPNARDCSPIDTNLDCGDYIKLYNPASAPIDTSNYRLRTDSGGLKSSTTNTFSLTGIISPSEYMMIRTRDSGEPMAITNTGGYVWLEDAHGVAIYQATMVSYPSADTTAAKGMSWAFDASDTTWKWMPPAPGAANFWPPNIGGKGGDVLVASADCGPGKERNPETNRCRNSVTVTASTLTPCKAGQERSPDTNRCRSVLSASTDVQPCNADQYRNPETNRCKKIASADTLAVCKKGYERNPETNRCRKATLASGDVASVKDVESKYKVNKTSWWLAGAAFLAALAYGIYEWRSDIAQRFARFKR